MLPYLNLDLKYLKKYAIKNECIQNTYNLWLKANILYSYKNAFRYEENISYNKFPLIIFEKHAYSIKEVLLRIIKMILATIVLLDILFYLIQREILAQLSWLALT